jgi:hypothetical protein
MTRVDGTAARKLDFGEMGTGRPASSQFRSGPTLQLAPARLALRGPDKYRILEQRRRRAQIEARRILDLLN